MLLKDVGIDGRQCQSSGRWEAMTVKIDNTEPNVFPVIEKIGARDSGRDAEVILATRIEGQLTPVTVKLSYQQAGDLWVQLEPFRHSKRGTT
jgi:hypothetical protein